MTTIATDGRTIAADSTMNWNNMHQGPFRKLHRVSDGIIGCAGEYEATLEFVDWYRDGGEKPALPDDLEALVLSADGVRYYGSRCTGFEVPCPVAIGSGSVIATAAMMAGASPIRALEIACLLDPASGGPVVCEGISEGLRHD